ITAEDPYDVPMRIYPAPHYVMGGLWVDYNLMSTVPGLYIGGEAKRNDDEYLYVGAWEYRGDDAAPALHKEPLVYEEVKLATRSYK
ncbi:MAG TPA: hypothetical protein VG323_21130, partial [Thermoanaerobaculia bacterium]|nr:hypothetical protein [Thermoanaerobaculia bacterium]